MKGRRPVMHLELTLEHEKDSAVYYVNVMMRGEGLGPGVTTNKIFPRHIIELDGAMRQLMDVASEELTSFVRSHYGPKGAVKVEIKDEA